MSTDRKTGSRSYTASATPHRFQWPVVWGAWAAYFAVAETVAVKSRRKDAPLSSYLRSLLRTRHGGLQRTIGQVFLGAFLTWLLAHIYRETSNDAR